MEIRRLRTTLFGESLATTRRTLVAAVVAMAGCYLLLTHTGPFGSGVNRWLGTNYTLVVAMAALTAIGAGTAALNDGVIVSIAVVAAPLGGYFLSGNVGFAAEPTLFGRIAYAAQGVALYGVSLGIVGYSIGRGLRCLGELGSPDPRR